MDLDQIPLLVRDIDLNSYGAAHRPIRSAFNGSSRELEAMVINFAHSPQVAVPASHKPGWRRWEDALDRLLDGGYVEPLHGAWHDMAGEKGRCASYVRTELFERTFRFRVPVKPVVTKSSLVTEEKHMCSTLYHNRTKLNSIPALSTYAKLIEGVELSLSIEGAQVRPKITDLHQTNGKRIYAPGTFRYQKLSGEERKFLLINGEPVVELDFTAMHSNMLLNKEGEPCHSDFYERILAELGLAPTKENRDAVKPLANSVLNVDKKGYSLTFAKAKDKHTKKRSLSVLGVKPSQVLQAMLRAHPKLEPYICTGDHSAWLQTADGDIMVDVLETLAKMGMVGLPMHDSVIAPAKYADDLKRIMADCYKKKMGFEPCIK